MLTSKNYTPQAQTKCKNVEARRIVIEVIEEETQLINKIKNFLKTNPTYEEIDLFYSNEILPHDKRSMTEILIERIQNG